MKIFDCHVHLFSPRIIENVIHKIELIQSLDLNLENIEQRLDPSSLMSALNDAGVCGALMLPTADVRKVAEVNRDCISTASRLSGLFTAGTLHPDLADMEEELVRLGDSGVRVLKLCSFSQKFSLSASNTYRMFDRIQSFNRRAPEPFSVVLDTLSVADKYFGSLPEHSTTPRLLVDLARRFPDVHFIGAHMGGLAAPFETLEEDLHPMPNLSLDTSNAAHTLTEEQFVLLLSRFGPDRIIFGTDWPWFLHKNEIELVHSRMEAAGFSNEEKQAVFHGNAEKIVHFDSKI